MPPKFKDNRYSRAIKVALNQRFHSKGVIHKHLASIIAAYSHKTLLRKHSCLMNKRLQFFIVSEVLSSHFCKGHYCPYMVNRNREGYVYVPNVWYRSRPCIKKIHEPFSRMPYVKDRKQKFVPRNQIKHHGTVQAYGSIIEQMH